MSNLENNLSEELKIILNQNDFDDYIIDILMLIIDENYTRETINKVLNKHGINKIEDIKLKLLDVLIEYANLVLDDHYISEKERENIEMLKLYFRIKEGDFYKYRHLQIEDIIHRQFERIYLDNTITKEEAKHSFNLQDLFDLSYDQFDLMKEKEIIRAMSEGTNIFHLDTARFPKYIK